MASPDGYKYNDFYEELLTKFRKHYSVLIILTGALFNVENAKFQNYIYDDILLTVLSFASVITIVYLYTSSLFLTIALVFILISSMGITFSVYAVNLQL